VKDFSGYRDLISRLYFLFREGVGDRLDGSLPASFAEVNVLRTELQHDTDHGDEKKVKAKKVKAGSVFKKYSGEVSPEALDPSRFVVVQANLLAAIEADLRALKVG
jgi:hypothetical protein